MDESSSDDLWSYLSIQRRQRRKGIKLSIERAREGEMTSGDHRSAQLPIEQDSLSLSRHREKVLRETFARVACTRITLAPAEKYETL